jgi:D-alanyl-D-alanine carboxypeptidase/D-alanyl-D-alanine-endopeptidase (penicillin-binding protein 4)
VTRRRRNPIPALIGIALVPALALAGVWRFAAGRTESAPAAPEASTPQSTPTPLVTPLLSLRRSPAVLARTINSATFTAAVQPMLDQVGDNACLAIAVDGQLIGAKNADVPLLPASNVKVVIAAVALDVLDADFVYTTSLRGELGADGTVTGDLVFVGGGDPLLSPAWWNGSNPKYEPFNETSLEALVDGLVAAGVKRVSGQIVADVSRYDNEFYAPTWMDGIRGIQVGPLSALLVADSRESNDRFSEDPVEGANRVLAGLLADRGIAVAGGVGGALEGPSTAGAELASVQSQPMSAVIAEMLTTSDNNTAEMMLKEIGFATAGTGTRDAGLAAVLAKLAEWGIDSEGVVLVDGSGISSENRLTCNVLLRVLQRGSVDDAVGAGLAVGGAPGGTLSDVYTDGPLAGVIRAKTGTLNEDCIPERIGAKTLSGYIPVPGGGAIEFALLQNGRCISDQSQYRALWDALADTAAVYLEGTPVDDLAPR